MARVTQEHIDARRRQILLAAMRMFGRKGLEPGAATIEDIAKEAGLSKGAIYGYYKNKDDLLEAIRNASVETDRVLFERATSQTDSSWDAFWAVARRVWDIMLDDEGREVETLVSGCVREPARRSNSPWPGAFSGFPWTACSSGWGGPG